VDGQQLAPYEPVEITENSKITFGGSTRVYQITGKDAAAPSAMGPPVGVPSGNRARPVPPVPVFNKQQEETAKAETRQQAGKEGESSSKDAEEEGEEEGRRHSRERRQAEIAAIMQEMTSSTPTWKPHTGKRRPLAQDASIISDDVDEDAVFVPPDEVGEMENQNDDDDEEEEDEQKDEDDEDDDDENDDDDFGPRPPSASERADADEGPGPGAAESSDPLDAFALSKQIPVSHSVELTGHSKSVLCVSYEPAGNRVVTGSMDYMVKMYDFGGMDRRHASFREARPEDGHPVIAVSHSPSGDRFIAAPHSNQPVVYDREGAFLIKFVSGDMYLRDQVKTKGHTKPVTGARWHPTERETMLTCALDGTLRIWDLGGETTFKMLINTTVIKTRNARGLTSRATCCTYGPEGSTVVAGTEDGTIQIWQRRKAYSRADTVLTPPGLSPIRWVEYSPDGSVLASRADNGIVHLWDVRQTSRPLKTFTDLHNIHETANVCFSPDGEMCVVATSPESRESGKSNLVWLPVKDASEEPCMKITVADAPYSGIAVKWHPTIKQIFCTMGSMSAKSGSMGTRVYYDPRFSVKGATRTGTDRNIAPHRAVVVVIFADRSCCFVCVVDPQLDEHRLGRRTPPISRLSERSLPLTLCPCSERSRRCVARRRARTRWTPRRRRFRRSRPRKGPGHR
jgi:WD40 repeat protein